MWERLVTEPARPDAVRRRPDAPWFVVGTVSIGAFMGQLDASIVTVALPSMRRDFGASLPAVEWVVLAYLLTLIGLVTGVGRLADMIGRKLLYTYGFVVFTAASVGCGLAPNLAVLDTFRVVQAVGAAMLQANSVALISTALPRARLGRGIGIQGAAQALGLAVGPTVGGALIAAGGWRWIFFVNVPVGILGVLLGWFLLPRSRDLAKRQPFDWLGLALFLPAVSALLLALSLAGRAGAQLAEGLGLTAAAVALGAAFVAWERRNRSPLLDLALFRRTTFSSGIASGLLSYLVLFGTLFVTPFFLEGARGLGTGQAGLLLTMLPVALGAAALFGGHWADRVGSRPPTVLGMALTAVALAGMAAGSGTVVVTAAGLAVAGLGLGLFTPANNSAIMSAAAREQSGMAGGVLNMTRGVGTALGVAVTGLIYGTASGHAQQATENAAAVTRGFSAALLALAGLAALAAGIAAIRGRPAATTPNRPG